MPWVKDRLAEQFGFEPKLFDPDLAVAKGAAIFAFEETYRRMLAQGGQQAEQANTMAARAGLSDEQQRAMRKRTIGTIAPRSYGIVIYDEHRRHEFVDHLVHANDPLPAERAEEYVTLEDNQVAIRVRVMEQSGAQESQEMSNNREIKHGNIAIPPRKPRGWPIEVTFHLDRSLFLTVTAIEREAATRLDLTVQIS
jgi:molecular chaperone DnaK (HSP70)